MAKTPVVDFVQRGPDFCRLPASRFSPRAHHDCRFRQTQCRVFDEHAVGKLFQRRQFGHLRAGGFQRADIDVVMLKKDVNIRCPRIDGADAVNNGTGRVCG